VREVDYIARYGGEEFTVLAPDTDLKSIALLAEKLLNVVETHRFPAQGKLTVSIGITQMLPDDTPELFIERADEALYRAKARGRNRCEQLDRNARRE
jgi:diguanylate cyclase (GGDEF)-like protein